MLTCQEVTAKSSQIIDGELGFRERFAVRLHLLMCVKCRLYYKQFKALVGSLSSGVKPEPEAPSTEFVRRVVGGVDALRDASPPPSESNDIQ